MRYHAASGEWTLRGLDGRIAIPIDGMPVPLLEEDYQQLDGEQQPSYDVVGRGIYYALRANPDCAYGETYARILQEGYPHFLSEMASHIVMLDKKDVDLAYLDREINYLKVFALIEPENFRFPLSIGKIYLDKGLSLSALHLTTVNLYRAEKFLSRARELAPEDVTAGYQLGEVNYLLGRYVSAVACWQEVLPHLDVEQAIRMERRLAEISAHTVPRVPPVDYLEAMGAAFTLHQRGEYEESAAILLDVLDDTIFCEQFPLPEISYILGLCSLQLGMPRHAEDYFRAALQMNPDYTEAVTALEDLAGP